MSPDSFEQRQRHRIGARLAGAVDDVVPILQPHLARQRLANLALHARDLRVECIEREEISPRLGGREQAREISILIGLAHQIFAMGERIHEELEIR
jgi:hypothetical protein